MGIRKVAATLCLKTSVIHLKNHEKWADYQTVQHGTSMEKFTASTSATIWPPFPRFVLFFDPKISTPADFLDLQKIQFFGYLIFLKAFVCFSGMKMWNTFPIFKEIQNYKIVLSLPKLKKKTYRFSKFSGWSVECVGNVQRGYSSYLWTG